MTESGVSMDLSMLSAGQKAMDAVSTPPNSLRTRAAET